MSDNEESGMTAEKETVARGLSHPVTVEHWFDFICPYCYVSQDRNRVLRERGITVAEYPVQIHPEIGPGGAFVGPRVGPVYTHLAQEAEAAGLPLRWGERIPYARPALAVHERLRADDPAVAERFAAAVFDAYFGRGEDIESAPLLATLAKEAGADPAGLRTDADPAAMDAALAQAEELGRRRGVNSTPTWIAPDGRVVSGLHSRRWFGDWAAALTR